MKNYISSYFASLLLDFRSRSWFQIVILILAVSRLNLKCRSNSTPLASYFIATHSKYFPAYLRRFHMHISYVILFPRISVPRQCLKKQPFLCGIGFANIIRRVYCFLIYRLTSQMLKSFLSGLLRNTSCYARNVMLS